MEQSEMGSDHLGFNEGTMTGFTAGHTNDVCNTQASEDCHYPLELIPKPCAATKSPCNKLPPELLTQIFILTLPRMQSEYFAIDFTYNTPWTLRSVCSMWRTVALRESRLWNNLRFGISTANTPSHFRWRLRFLNNHILLSQRPFLMTILCSKNLAGTFINMIYEEILVPNLARFEQLHLTLPLVTMKEFFQLPYNCFSLLKVLSLRAAPEGPAPINEEIFFPAHDVLISQFRISGAPVFRSMIQLRDFSIDFHLWFGMSLEPISSVPWMQLTMLRIFSSEELPLHVSSAVKILGPCVNLLSCELILHEATYHPDNSSIHHLNSSALPVNLPHLRTLKVEHNASFDVTLSPGSFIITDFLSTPALQKLHIQHAGFGSNFSSCSSVKHLIERSGCALLDLKIDDGPQRIPQSINADFLSLIPQIKQLSTPGFMYSVPILYKIGEGIFLRELQVFQCRGNASSLAAMLSLLERRYKSADTTLSRLHRLTLCMDGLDYSKHSNLLAASVAKAKLSDAAFDIQNI